MKQRPLKLINCFKHLTTVLKHKFWVGYYCFKAGLYKQGLLHDVSKLSPAEFFESARYYTGTHSPIDESKKENGYSAAWLHHKGRNKHHYEYWQDNFDKGGEALQMPFEYALEMICDYLGAGRAYWGKEFTLEKEWEWWLSKKKNSLAMHPKTKEFVDKMMEEVCKHGQIELLDYSFARMIYNVVEVGAVERDNIK